MAENKKTLFNVYIVYINVLVSLTKVSQGETVSNFMQLHDIFSRERAVDSSRAVSVSVMAFMSFIFVLVGDFLVFIHHHQIITL